MPDAQPPEQQPSFLPRMEEEISAYWKKQNIFQRSLDERSENRGYVFYDGPPFATGLPHYGHLLQSTLKDVVPRYWTMQGYRVPRVWGWDCHGLPIENLIEKELKLRSKKDIEEYGIDTFNAACRASVSTYEKEWGMYVDRIGRWVDFAHSYKTLDDDYIESVWWVFSELYQKKLIYKNVRVSLYCPRCSTPLSNFEIAMDNSYKDVDDPAIIVKFPVVGEEKTFFLAWTTTPWSLPGNTGLSVHPDLMYVSVHVDETQETLIFAESRQSDVLKQYYPLASAGVPFKMIDRWKGSELVGKRYEPLYPSIAVEGDGFRVVSGAHVSGDDGTGIVHTAPAFGEEDLQMSRDHGLPILMTLDEEGRMTAETGAYAGMARHDANRPIMDELASRGLLYRAETIKHSVPVCWRCQTLLLYKAQPAWFVDVTTLHPKLLKTAQKINWHPEHFKEGRFGKGLQTAPDWNISRTRYWGSPLPVWECTACDERTIIGSIAELKSKAKPESLPAVLDLHRPVIDQVVIPCACGAEQKRIPEVFDCWFESGSMPVATCHYPFEKKKWFEDHFPADFIAEGQDQTRGWFYTLHVIATALFNKPAFSHVIVTGMVLAEDGRKMSKSLKNYPEPWGVLTTFGADALRYYLMTSPIVEAEALNFSEKDLQIIVRGFLNLIWNVKTFYLTYATSDVPLMMPRSAHILDRWLFSRFQTLLKEVTTQMNAYQIDRASRPIRDFVDDLSTWWLRRSRERMKSEDAYERMDALRTLKEMLLELTKVMAPFMPFISEKIYLELGGMKASVHLESWSKVQEKLIDARLMQDMSWVRAVVSRGHELRTASKMPVRQALAKITIVFQDDELRMRLSQQRDLLKIMKDELNVEEIVLEHHVDLEDAWVAKLDTVLTPELKQKGLQREFARHAMNLRKKAELHPTDRIVLRCVASVHIREAVEQVMEVVKKDIKADAVEWVEKIEGVRWEEEVKIDGTACVMGLV